MPRIGRREPGCGCDAKCMNAVIFVRIQKSLFSQTFGLKLVGGLRYNTRLDWPSRQGDVGGHRPEDDGKPRAIRSLHDYSDQGAGR